MMSYSFMLICFIYLFSFFLFYVPCVSRDLIIYSQYLEWLISPPYFTTIAPFIFSFVYSLQSYYLLSRGFSPALVLCYVSLTILTLGVNQLLLSIGITYLIYAKLYGGKYSYKIVSAAIHPSLTMILLFNKDGNFKILSYKVLLIFLGLWLGLIWFFGQLELGEFLFNMPQKNVSNFGYYLIIHYYEEANRALNSMAGFENLLLFAIISFATKKWTPLFYEFIAFQSYTLFDTIPFPMGFRLFEVFTYLLFIHAYGGACVRYPKILCIFALLTLLYKIKYVFGCSFA